MRSTAADWLGKVRRGLKKPPGVIAYRIKAEMLAELERFNAPLRDRRLDNRRLLTALRANSLGELWDRLASNVYPALTKPVRIEDYERVCPGDGDRILAAAQRALAHEVDLLGSGPVCLGKQIDWHRDYKTDFRWTPRFFRRIDYNNPDRPSDVKFPWEVSRLQWLIPAGQAYLLTGDERYAREVRAVLEDWIEANPFAHSVNWSCTMEVALRIISWTWFFHVFAHSKAWKDEDFRSLFLRTLFLHADFTERHLERSDINGNHYTADAAGLLVAGLFFRVGEAPKRWAELGWQILCEELPRQVYADGVDFEASTAYHRLVLELFLLPALYRERCGQEVPPFYREALTAMARFSAAYSRPDGTVPFWGDADDARALPFGGQSTNDHRYLGGLVGAAWDVSDLKKSFTGSRAEIFWLLGKSAAASLPSANSPQHHPASCAFRDGGVYIMCNEQDHVFVDCGAVGLGGRGGHGHNDCLSFEAVLAGAHLVTDCGSYVYTASYEERNNFRSTRYHNTPIVDGEEINRFIRPDYLWNLHYDALPECRIWLTNDERDVFQGTHAGYTRLSSGLQPVRTLVLHKRDHILVGIDAFEGGGEYIIEIPFHLGTGIHVGDRASDRCELHDGKCRFMFVFDTPKDWSLDIGNGVVSPRYGVRTGTYRLRLTRHGQPRTVGWAFAPAETAERAIRLVDEAKASYVS
jgi:Heparinase II/III N-terminus/Heparinase II/III-like protein